MNPVAEQLTGWSLSQAQGSPLGQVFQIVEEANRETVLNPIDRVLQRDHPVKFSDGTLLIRRDGAEYSIHEVAAPIRDREDRITGLVVVFRGCLGGAQD